MRKNELEKAADEILEILEYPGQIIDTEEAAKTIVSKLNAAAIEYQKTKFADSIAVLIEALNADRSEGSYYHVWKSNIAMAFKDEWQRRQDDLIKNPVLNKDQEGEPEEEKSFTIDEVADQAAIDFLDILGAKKRTPLDESTATPPQEELPQRSE